MNRKRTYGCKVATFQNFVTNYNMNFENILIINGERFVECPFCHKPFKSLVRHIPMVHKIPMEEFHKDFPNYAVQIGDTQLKDDSLRELKKQFVEYYNQFLKEDGLYHCPTCDKGFKRTSGLQEHCLSHGIKLPTHKDFYGDKKTDENYTCPYCHQAFKNYRGLQVHLSIKHKEEYAEILKSRERTEGFECPICNKIVGGLADHVMSKHHMDWKLFCKEYNWIWGGSYITEEHRKNLSINKKNFYNNTERGLELREEQSKKGLITSSVMPNCRSYYFSSNNEPFKYCRSFQEYMIIYVLNKNNFEYKYEPFSIEYMREGLQHHYTPDILIENNLYEIKSDNEEYEENDKYRIIEEILSKTPYTLRVLTVSNYPELLKIKRIPLAEIYYDVKRRFYEDETFYIHGKFIYDQNLKQDSSLLKLIFDEDYESFVEENLKRIKLVNENK